MNITHAEHEELQKNLTIQIFERQKELMEKYHEIERASGLMITEDCPVNLDDKRGQLRLKDFFWRVTEELGEALDALREGDMDHYKEELVDGLHFLTELSILAGANPTGIGKTVDIISTIDNQKVSLNNNLSLAIVDFVREAGMAANCFKNKPWKQTQMKTDQDHFFKQLELTWEAYCHILSFAFKDGQEVTDTYLRKSQVNKFRQRTYY